MTTWLPRCRTAAKPRLARIAHTSAPLSTRSLPNRDLDPRDVHLAREPASNLGLVG
jgi:hypothetical protein